MPHPALTPRSSPRRCCAAGSCPSPTGDKNTRGSILVIGGSSETLGAVLLAAEAAHAGRRGQAAGGDGGVGRARSPPPRCPRRWCGRCPRPTAGAISADAADAVRDLAEAADAVLHRAGHGRQGGDPGVRRAAAAAPARVRWRWTRSGWPASPPTTPACTTSSGRVVLTPNPTGAGLRAARRRGRARRRPGGRRRRPGRPRAGRRRARRRHSWVAAPDGALWRDDSGAAGARGLRLRRRAGRASPAGCSPAAPTRRRRRSGRPSCTAAAASGCPRPSGGWASWPASCRRRSREHSPRSPADCQTAADDADRGGRRATRQLHR